MNNEKDPITEYLKIVIKTMFTQNIIVIAIALGLAIISAFITCITWNKIIKVNNLNKEPTWLKHKNGSVEYGRKETKCY